MNQACYRVRQLIGKDLKKVNVFEVDRAQYTDSKSLANKMGNTLTKLYFPQNYDSTFSETKQKEEQKTLHLNHTNRGNYKKPFSKEDLTRGI